MHSTLSLIAALTTIVALLNAQTSRYPLVPPGNVVDEYFGTLVPDPYRALEDLGSPATHAFVAEQNRLTEAYLARIPFRPALHRRLTELWNYARMGLPHREAGRLFYRKNTGLQRQSIVYERSGPGENDRAILDPNLLSPDGSIALAGYRVSPDGRYLAYGLSQGGSDFATWRVRELKTSRALPDSVSWVKFSGVSWTLDGRGFFYARYPEPDPGKALTAAAADHRVYYHRVGTPQSSDQLVYRDPEHPDWFHWTDLSEDGRYLWIRASAGGPSNRLYYADLGSPLRPRVDASVVKLVDHDGAEYRPIGNVGDTLYLSTNFNAPRRRIVAVILPDTSRVRWRTIVPERTEVIEDAVLAGGRVVVQYLRDVNSRLAVYTRDGSELEPIPVPGIGAVEGLSARNDTPELFYGFVSFLTPQSILRYDVRSGTQKVFEGARTTFDSSRYQTRQVFYYSKDGTRIPMFITGRKDLRRNGENPTLLYAYGGFAASMTPSYSPADAAWLELGGFYAVPNVRGGGEYGEEWHQAGMRDKKQNVFDDFIAAAEYLIQERYTSPGKLAMQGSSNGGLMVGAVMTQRPDLFRVALPDVGVFDMLRYQRFSAGRFWVAEYGSSADSAAFRTLLKYSPLHNVKPKTCYPATLVTTADHDDRVVPSHSYKYVARLQEAQHCDRPVLLRVETQASHGYIPTDKQISEAADALAFTAENLGVARLR
jgi:prolyl oligopeptidase